MGEFDNLPWTDSGPRQRSLRERARSEDAKRRLNDVAETILSRLEEEAEVGSADLLDDLSSALWNVFGAAGEIGG